MLCSRLIDPIRNDDEALLFPLQKVNRAQEHNIRNGIQGGRDDVEISVRENFVVVEAWGRVDDFHVEPFAARASDSERRFISQGGPSQGAALGILVDQENAFLFHLSEVASESKTVGSAPYPTFGRQDA